MVDVVEVEGNVSLRDVGVVGDMGLVGCFPKNGGILD